MKDLANSEISNVSGGVASNAYGLPSLATHIDNAIEMGIYGAFGYGLGQQLRPLIGRPTPATAQAAAKEVIEFFAGFVVGFVGTAVYMDPDCLDR